MSRFNLALCVTPLLLTAACNVTKDAANDSATISVDQNRIENGAADVLNQAANVTEVAANKIENAGPELENSAATIKERAGRVVNNAEALGNRIETKVDSDKPTENKAQPGNH